MWTLWSVPMMIYGVYALSVTALLFAEVKSKDALKWVCKPLAGLIFLYAALFYGAGFSIYGHLIFLGLALSFVGDCALLKQGTGRVFALGVLAFAAAHMAYGFAFAHIAGVHWLWPFGLFALCLIGYALPKQQSPDGPHRLDRLITVYSAMIAVMTGLAFYAAWKTGLWVIALAAILFVISDIFVGRNRFGPSNPKQFWVITPFYFAAQILFAISIGIAA